MAAWTASFVWVGAGTFTAAGAVTGVDDGSSTESMRLTFPCEADHQHDNVFAEI